MPKAYRFNEDQIAELEEARKRNKNKNVDRRLRALLLRAKDESRKEVGEKTGFSQVRITELTVLYHKKGAGCDNRKSL